MPTGLLEFGWDGTTKAAVDGDRMRVEFGKCGVASFRLAIDEKTKLVLVHDIAVDGQWTSGLGVALYWAIIFLHGRAAAVDGWKVVLNVAFHKARGLLASVSDLGVTTDGLVVWRALPEIAERDMGTCLLENTKTKTASMAPMVLGTDVSRSLLGLSGVLHFGECLWLRVSENNRLVLCAEKNGHVVAYVHASNVLDVRTDVTKGYQRKVPLFSFETVLAEMNRIERGLHPRTIMLFNADHCAVVSLTPEAVRNPALRRKGGASRALHSFLSAKKLEAYVREMDDRGIHVSDYVVMSYLSDMRMDNDYVFKVQIFRASDIASSDKHLVSSSPGDWNAAKQSAAETAIAEDVREAAKNAGATTRACRGQRASSALHYIICRLLQKRGHVSGPMFDGLRAAVGNGDTKATQTLLRVCDMAVASVRKKGPVVLQHLIRHYEYPYGLAGSSVLDVSALMHTREMASVLQVAGSAKIELDQRKVLVFGTPGFSVVGGAHEDAWLVCQRARFGYIDSVPERLIQRAGVDAIGAQLMKLPLWCSVPKGYLDTGKPTLGEELQLNDHAQWSQYLLLEVLINDLVKCPRAAMRAGGMHAAQLFYAVAGAGAGIVAGDTLTSAMGVRALMGLSGFMGNVVHASGYYEYTAGLLGAAKGAAKATLDNEERILVAQAIDLVVTGVVAKTEAYQEPLAKLQRAAEDAGKEVLNREDIESLITHSELQGTEMEEPMLQAVQEGPVPKRGMSKGEVVKYIFQTAAIGLVGTASAIAAASAGAAGAAVLALGSGGQLPHKLMRTGVHVMNTNIVESLSPYSALDTMNLTLELTDAAHQIVDASTLAHMQNTVNVEDWTNQVGSKLHDWMAVRDESADTSLFTDHLRADVTARLELRESVDAVGSLRSMAADTGFNYDAYGFSSADVPLDVLQMILDQSMQGRTLVLDDDYTPLGNAFVGALGGSDINTAKKSMMHAISDEPLDGTVAMNGEKFDDTKAAATASTNGAVSGAYSSVAGLGVCEAGKCSIEQNVRRCEAGACGILSVATSAAIGTSSGEESIWTQTSMGQGPVFGPPKVSSAQVSPPLSHTQRASDTPPSHVIAPRFSPMQSPPAQRSAMSHSPISSAPHSTWTPQPSSTTNPAWIPSTALVTTPAAHTQPQPQPVILQSQSPPLQQPAQVSLRVLPPRQLGPVLPSVHTSPPSVPARVSEQQLPPSPVQRPPAYALQQYTKPRRSRRRQPKKGRQRAPVFESSMPESGIGIHDAMAVTAGAAVGVVLAKVVFPAMSRRVENLLNSSLKLFTWFGSTNDKKIAVDNAEADILAVYDDFFSVDTEERNLNRDLRESISGEVLRKYGTNVGSLATSEEAKIFAQKTGMHRTDVRMLSLLKKRVIGVFGDLADHIAADQGVAQELAKQFLIKVNVLSPTYLADSAPLFTVLQAVRAGEQPSETALSALFKRNEKKIQKTHLRCWELWTEFCREASRAYLSDSRMEHVYTIGGRTSVANSMKNKLIGKFALYYPAEALRERTTEDRYAFLVEVLRMKYMYAATIFAILVSKDIPLEQEILEVYAAAISDYVIALRWSDKYTRTTQHVISDALEKKPSEHAALENIEDGGNIEVSKSMISSHVLSPMTQMAMIVALAQPAMMHT